MKAALIVPPVSKKILEDTDFSNYNFIVGIDGALDTIFSLTTKEIKIDLALGDFDSLIDKSLLLRVKHLRLPKDKDDTDTLFALKYLYKKSITDITIYGGLAGDRIEHLYANLNLFYQFDMLKIVNDNNKIFKLKKGTYEFLNIDKANFDYISFFPLEDNTLVTLEGFKFNFDNYNLNKGDITGISNELEGTGIIRVFSNSVIVFEHKKN